MHSEGVNVPQEPRKVSREAVCSDVIAQQYSRRAKQVAEVKEEMILKHLVASIFIGNSYSDQRSWLLDVRESHIFRMSWKMEKHMKGVLALGNNASRDFRLKR